MDTATVLALAFGIGIIAGLRTATAPAVVSWGAVLGWISLQATPLAFLGYTVTAWILTVLALGELVSDKLPKTPSRKSPGPFVGRVVLGGLSGAALAAAGHQSLLLGALIGALGGVAGTLGGYAARTGLVKALKSPDLPIALLEDIVAIGGGFLLVSRF